MLSLFSELASFQSQVCHGDRPQNKAFCSFRLRHLMFHLGCHHMDANFCTGLMPNSVQFFTWLFWPFLPWFQRQVPSCIISPHLSVCIDRSWVQQDEMIPLRSVPQFVKHIASTHSIKPIACDDERTHRYCTFAVVAVM